MTHDDAGELIALYVLDILDADDRRRLGAHLATCPACRAELASLRPVTDALLVAFGDNGDPQDAVRDHPHQVGDAQEPGVRMRHRQHRPRSQPVAAQPSWSALPAWLATAAAVLLAVAGLLEGRRASQRVERISTELTAARTEISVLTAPDGATSAHVSQSERNA